MWYERCKIAQYLHYKYVFINYIVKYKMQDWVMALIVVVILFVLVVSVFIIAYFRFQLP